MGKINAYVCPKLHITVTEDIHAGTTPMIIPCPHCEEEQSKGYATSLFYNVDQNFRATHEWFKPSIEDLKDMQKDMTADGFQNTIEHVYNGGLLLREKQKEVQHG